MTTIAGRVGIKARRDRHRYPAARFAMTSGATNAAHVHVKRVIEFHAKAFQTGKWLLRSGFHIRVTDRADRTFVIRELLRVTAGAGKML